MQLEIDLPLDKPAIDDVTAVTRNRRPHPRFDQILDLVDDVGIGRVFLDMLFGRNVDAGRAAGREQRRAPDEMVKQSLEYDRLEVGPRHAGSRRYRDG